MIIVYLTTFDIRHIPGHYVVAFSRRIVLGADLREDGYRGI